MEDPVATGAEAGIGATVLFATYNRRAMLPEVLEPILADPGAREVVVVVDGCEDGSLELLEALAKSEPRLRPLYVSNRGPARALLAGAEAARGSVLVILDDDEILEPGAVSGHLAHHAERADLVVVGYVGMRYPLSRRPGDFARYIYGEQYERDCESWEREPDQILRNLWGGFISLRRENYLRVQAGLDQYVEGYHYDLDFGARCLELGLVGVFDRSLRAEHVFERSPRQFMRDARVSGRNRAAIHRAHPTVLAPLDPAYVEQGLPAPGRILLRAALRAPLVAELVRAATVAAGRLHLWRLESMGAGLGSAIERKRGALEAARGFDGARPSTGRPRTAPEG